MPAPTDQPLWDDEDAPKSAPRAKRVTRPALPPPARRGGFKHKDYDVVAEVVGGEGGARVWLFGGIGIGVLAIVGLIVWATSGGEPQVADAPPVNPVPVNPQPVNPQPVDPLPPVNPPPVVPPKPPAPVAIGLIPRPEDPAAVGRRIDVRLGARQLLDHSPAKLVFAAKHGLLVTMDERHARVYDPLAGKVVATLTAKEKFNDLALTPDESAVLVADYGGERNVTGKDGQHYVHRFTFATATAATTKVVGVAHAIVAPTPDRFIIGSSDQWTDGTLNAWPRAGETAEEVLKFSTGRESPLAFDPFGGRLLHHITGTSQRAARFVFDRGLSAEPPRDFKHLADAGPLVLSTDGISGYQGRTQFDPDKPMVTVRTFPERIVAASRDVAFGSSGNWYRADNAQLVHGLPFKPRAVALARHGKSGWAVDAAGDLWPLELREVLGIYTPPADAAQTTEGPPVVPSVAPAIAPPANPFPAGVALRATASPSVKPARQSALWAGYVPATNTVYIQAAGEVIPLDGTTGEPRPVAGGPRLARATALAPDKSALFSFDERINRLDVATGKWTSSDWHDRNGSPVSRFVPVSAVTVVTLAQRFATDGRLSAVRWNGTEAQTLATVKLDVQEVTHLGYDPATGYLLVGCSNGREAVFRRMWLDGAKFRTGTPITLPGKPVTFTDRLVVSETGGFAFVGPYRLSVKDGKAEQVDYGGKVVAAVHDWVLTDKGELRDAATGKTRGELGEAKLQAAAFAPDGRTVWVANNRTEVNRYALAADAGGVVVNPPVKPPVNPPEPVAVETLPVAYARPKTVSPAEPWTAVTKGAAVAQGSTQRQLVHLDKRDLLLTFHRQKFEAITTKGESVVSIPEAGTESHVSASPDQSVLFVVTTQVPGAPANPVLFAVRSNLGRYDVEKKKWEDVELKGTQPTRVVAVGNSHVVVHTRAIDHRDKPKLALCRWDRADGKVRLLPRLTELFALELPDLSPVLLFDPAASVLFTVGSSETDHAFVVRRFKLTATALTELGNTSVPRQDAGHPMDASLSADGSRLHLGKRVVETATGKLSAVTYPELILAATRDVALGDTGIYYEAATGRRLGTLAGVERIGLAAVSPDGSGFWVEVSAGGFQRYTVGPAKAVEVADWMPAKRKPPVQPEAAGTLTKLTETAALPTTFAPFALLPLPEKGLLVIHGKDGLPHVLDAATGTAVTPPPDGLKVTALSAAPDGSAIFACDGTRLHRYDVAGKKWESKPLAVRHVAAVSGTLAFVAVRPAGFKPPPAGVPTLPQFDPTGLRVVEWTAADAPVEKAALAGTATYSWIAANPFTGGLSAVHLNHGFPTAPPVTLFEFAVSGKQLVETGATKWTGSEPYPRIALSPDFGRVQVDDKAVSLSDPKRPVTAHKFVAAAASRDLTFFYGLEEYYRADTGARVGTAPFPRGKRPGFPPDEPVAVAPDGRSVWVYDSDKKTLRCYAITADTGVAVAPPGPTGKIEDFKPTLLPRPAVPPTPTKLTETAAFDGLLPSTLLLADRHGVLVVATGGKVQLLDAATGKPLPGAAPPDGLLLRLALAPDQSALFANSTTALHRYDFAAKKWDSRRVQGREVVPLDGTTVLLSPPFERPNGARVVRWTADGTETLGTADLPAGLPAGGNFAYDPATGRLYALVRGSDLKLQLKQYPVGGKPFVAEWVTDVAVRPEVRPLPTADGKRVILGAQAYDAATGKPAGDPLPETIRHATPAFLVGSSGKLYHPDTGKELSVAVPHPTNTGAVASDGKSAVFLDLAQSKVRRYEITAGAVNPPVNPPVPKEPPLVADDWTPTAVERAKLAAAPGTQTVLARAAAGTLGTVKAAEVLHSDRHERLVVAESNGRVLVYDGKTLEALPTDGGPTATVEMTMAPDQSAVFASARDKLHRLDLATLKWTARDNPFGSRIAAVGEDRLVANDGLAKPTLTLVKWGTDAVVPTARIDLPGPADLIRYDPAAATAYVLGREGVLTYFTRVTVDKGKLAVSPKVRVPGPFNGGRVIRRLPLSWDGGRILGDMAVNADGAVSVIPGALPGDVVGASRDLVFCQQSVLVGGKQTRPAAYPGGTLIAVSPAGDTVFAVGGDKVTRLTLSAAAPPVPKGKIEDFKPTLLPRVAAPATPLTKFTEAAAFDEANGPTTVLLLDRHGVMATVSTAGGLRLRDAATGLPLEGAAPLAGGRTILAAVAPDQSALFAVTTDAVHRYDIATKKWEKRAVQGTRAVPLDGSTILLSPPAGKAEPWQLLKWTAAGTDILGTADVPSVGTHTYDPATGHLYSVVRRPAQNSQQLMKFQVGGKPFAAEWTADLPALPAQTPRPVVSADGKRVYAGKQAFDAATGKPVGAPFPETIRHATHGFLLGDSKLYHPDTGKELAALPHTATVGAVASDGKSAVLYDRAGVKLRRYDITAGAVNPPVNPPTPKEPPKGPKNPPLVVPFPPGPKKAARPELPFAAGTQTVVKEVSRLTGADARATVVIAAEPLGLVAAMHREPLRGGLRLFDVTEEKAVPVGQPTTDAAAELFAPPDRSALFVHDRKKVYRLRAGRKGWDAGDLPADTRYVVAVGKDRVVAVADIAASTSTFHELAWADGKWGTVRETKVPLMLGHPRVAPAGDRLLAFGRALYGQTELKLHEFDLTDGGPVAARSVALREQKEAILGTFRLSWDGTHAYRQMSAFDLTGAKVREFDPPLKAVSAASRDLLFAADGRYFTPLGKPVGELGHAIRAADMTPDGKAVWVLDPDKKELVKYALTDGK